MSLLVPILSEKQDEVAASMNAELYAQLAAKSEEQAL